MLITSVSAAEPLPLPSRAIYSHAGHGTFSFEKYSGRGCTTNGDVTRLAKTFVNTATIDDPLRREEQVEATPTNEENAMKPKVIYLASAALGAAFFVSGSAWAQMGGAPRERGNYCATPVTTCALARASWVGAGCSCRTPGGRTRGTVASSYGYAPSASANPFGGLAGAITAPVATVAAAPAVVAAAAPAPLMTGRSVANGQIGNYCTTPKGVPFTNSRVMPDGQLRPYDPAIDGPCR
jgi:hypothetical protein